MDADHTGTITLDELKAYFDRVGIQHDDLAKTFQALDVDKDGDDGTRWDAMKATGLKVARTRSCYVYILGYNITQWNHTISHCRM